MQSNGKSSQRYVFLSYTVLENAYAKIMVIELLIRAVYTKGSAVDHLNHIIVLELRLPVAYSILKSSWSAGSDALYLPILGLSTLQVMQKAGISREGLIEPETSSLAAKSLVVKPTWWFWKRRFSGWLSQVTPLSALDATGAAVVSGARRRYSANQCRWETSADWYGSQFPDPPIRYAPDAVNLI